MTGKRYGPGDGFPYYFDLVKNEDIKTLFSSSSTFEFLETVDEHEATFRYAPGKWSIKQIVGHITDHERIKMFRAFVLSRNQSIELWGYDQNTLIENSRFEELSFEEIKADFQNVRNASKSFINTLSNQQLMLTGNARNHNVTLRDFLKSNIGHELHHINIIKERYI